MYVQLFASSILSTSATSNDSSLQIMGLTDQELRCFTRCLEISRREDILEVLSQKPHSPFKG